MSDCVEFTRLTTGAAHPSRMDTARSRSALLAVAAIWAAALSIHAATRVPTVAIAFDLLVTASVAAYWLGLRGRRLAFVIATGAVGARWVLAADATHLALAIVAALELAAVTLLLVRVRRARRGWRAARAQGFARIDALDRALDATGLP